MDKKDVCIATITWARTQTEEDRLRESLLVLSKLGIPVIATDGGSPGPFVEFMQSLPLFSVLSTKEKGVHAQAKNSLQAAYNTQAGFIFYTEPDKKDFFAEVLPAFVSKITVNEKTGIILASRSAKSFASFPAFQQMTETTINDCCAEVIQKKLDYTYGPFLLNRLLIPHLELLGENVGWGWRPFVFVTAARLGLMVDAMEGDFYCPADQQPDDAKERIYRMKQLEQNIRGIIHSAEAAL